MASEEKLSKTTIDAMASAAKMIDLNSKSMQIALKLQEEMSGFLKTYIDGMRAPMLAAMEALRSPAIAQIHAMNASMFESLKLAMPVLPMPLFSEEILKRMAEMRVRLDRLESSDFEYKWLQSISTELGNKLMELHETGGNQAVSAFLIAMFKDRDFIEGLKNDMGALPAYRERKQIIDDCLEAHLEGKYTLSIPTLLTQCDGVVINKVVQKTLYTGKAANFVNMKTVASDGHVQDQRMAKHMITIYDSKRLNVLHGKDVVYYQNGGEELSVKVIWTLFEIMNMAEDF